MRLRRKKKQNQTKTTEESVDKENSDTSVLSGESKENSPPSSPGNTSEDDKNVTLNGEMKSNSLNSGCKTPPVERKPSKLAAFSRIFKPWKWKRRKKPSEKIEKTAVDLERKISVRTSREELIKRGVLKEVAEDPIPLLPSHPETPEEPEAVQDDKVETTQVQANGTPSTADSVHLHETGPCGPHGDVQTELGSPDDELPPPHNNGIISTQADITQLPQHSPPIVCTSQVRLSIGEGQGMRAGSPQIDPKLMRVMLPVEEKDRHLPVLQRQLSAPPEPDNTPEPEPPAPRNPYHIYKAIPSPQPVSFEGPELSTPPCSQAHLSHGSGNYTPSGLTFATPVPRVHLGVPTTTGYGTPTTHQVYEEVPAHEPDLSKKPLRSALKGAKRQQEQQMNLQAQLQQQLQATLSRKGAPPKIAPKPKVRLLSSSVKVVDPHNKENQPVDHYDEPDYDNLHSDSDDDEVHYDDRESSLAAKVRRQDSLARFLSQRPHRRELIERNILPCKSEKERIQDKQYISGKLNRRLSLRPTAEELEEKNILHRQSYEQMRLEREEMKRTLVRKLSFRPTVDELKERKIIKFSDYVEVTECNEYDRRADKPWTRLTPRDKAAIRKELNEFKSSEMEVHEESRHLTRFHRP